MTQHDRLLRVRHMRDYAQEAVDLLDLKTLDELFRDRTLQLALLRCVEIIGEASTRVDALIKLRHPGVAWADAAAMRHKLIHDYHLVKIETVYDTVRNDLPPLITNLDQVLAQG